MFDPNNDELFEEEPAIVGFQTIVLPRLSIKNFIFAIT